MTTIAPWDIVVAFVLIVPMVIILLRWRGTMSRWRWGWIAILVLAVGYELWAQFDSDPLTFTFSEGLTRNFTLKELWIGGTIIYLVLQIHWPDLVRRGYGIVKRRMAK